MPLAQMAVLVRHHIENDMKALCKEIYAIDGDGHLGLSNEMPYEVAFFIGYVYHYSAMTTINHRLTVYQLIEVIDTHIIRIIVALGKSEGLGWLARSVLKRQYKSRLVEYRALMSTRMNPYLIGEEMVKPFASYLVPDPSVRLTHRADVQRILEWGQSTMLGVHTMFRSDIAGSA